MRILGVDPGLRVTGYGVIEISEDRKGARQGAPLLLEAGIIQTRELDGIAGRLTQIYQSLSEVIVELKPETLVIERLYANYKHPATAILMGHARGVVCLLSGVHHLPLASIASTQIKKSVTGQGHAGKLQIQRMVQHVLGLKTLPSPPDVADALAVAITYASQVKGKRR